MYKYISQDKTISAISYYWKNLVKLFLHFTSHIDLDNHYCVVALCYKAAISGVAVGADKDIVDVVPILAKLSLMKMVILKSSLSSSCYW